jgi:hypothetical protein
MMVILTHVEILSQHDLREIEFRRATLRSAPAPHHWRVVLEDVLPFEDEMLREWVGEQVRFEGLAEDGIRYSGWGTVDASVETPSGVSVTILGLHPIEGELDDESAEDEEVV